MKKANALVYGTAVLQDRLRELGDAPAVDPDACWRLLCDAYALGNKGLLPPLWRILGLALRERPSQDVPEGIREMLLDGAKAEVIGPALAEYGRSRRNGQGDSGTLEVRQYSPAYAAHGALVFTGCCPVCGGVQSFDPRSDAVDGGRLPCLSCFAELCVESDDLRRVARESLLAHAQRLSRNPSPDDAQVMHMLAAAWHLRGILDVYFVKLRSERIGHFILNTALFLAYLRQGGALERSLLFAFPPNPDKVCNPYLLTFWERFLTVAPWARRAHELCKGHPDLGALAVDLYNPDDPKLSCDMDGMLERYPLRAGFNTQEREEARRQLEAMGIGRDMPYVCVLGRDDAYLDRHLPGGPAGGWKYHDYRNVSIGRYLPALKWLSGQGVSSLRMGHHVKEALDSDDPRIVDYASHFRTPFMDVYLGSTCLFYISCMTGPDIMPLVMGRPLLQVNVPQYLSKHFFADSRVLAAFKKVRCNATDRYLSFEEVLQRGLGGIISTEELAAADISLEEHSSEELLAIVQEMTARCQGRWEETGEEARLQARFRELSAKYADTPRTVRARISMSFLRMNPYFLD